MISFEKLEKAAARLHEARRLARWLPTCVWLLILLSSQALRADVSVDVSPLFPLDTRWEPGTSASISGSFILDTRYGQGISSNISGRFILDTRLSSSFGLSASGDFIVDTRGATVANASITGRVSEANGNSLAGAFVQALQSGVHRASALSDGSGIYQLALPAGLYELRASKGGFQTGIRGALYISPNQNATQNFTLEPTPATPVTQATTRQPTSAEAGTVIQPVSTQLKVYVSGAFQSGLHPNPNAMTIVLTHGMDSSPQEWAANMAQKLADANLFPPVNIVAWDWESKAIAYLKVPPIDESVRQGKVLGQALWQELGANYQKQIHFVGHSLGTIVNAYAANYLHGDLQSKPTVTYLPSRTHMTLLDEAEIASVAGQEVGLTGAKTLITTGNATLTAVSMTAQAAEDWRSPIPKRFSWIDNYISTVGVPHASKAVNIYLQQGALNIGAYSIAALHSYPCRWYSLSVAAPTQSLMGHRNSFERLGSLPPPGILPFGSFYAQPLFGPTELGVEELTTPADIALADATQRALAGLVATKNGADWTIEKLGEVGTAIQDKYIVGIYATSDVLYRTGSAVQNTYDRAIYYAGDKISDFGIWTTHVTSDLTLKLKTRLNIGLLKNGTANANGSDNESPGAWVTLTLPPDAALMSFDFMLNGDGQSDRFTAAVGGTNVFTLETEFMEEGVPMPSGMIDVSRWAGQSVELFFGVVGGTSADATVTVDGIQFYSLPQPKLAVGIAQAQVLVSWPVSATGYILESASTLQPNSWNLMTNTPAVVNFQNVVTNDYAQASRFYRLRRL